MRSRQRGSRRSSFCKRRNMSQPDEEVPLPAAVPPADVPPPSQTPRPPKASSTALLIRESDRMRTGIDAVVLEAATGSLSLYTRGQFVIDEQVKVRLKNIVQRFEKETRGLVRDRRECRRLDRFGDRAALATLRAGSLAGEDGHRVAAGGHGLEVGLNGPALKSLTREHGQNGERHHETRPDERPRSAVRFSQVENHVRCRGARHLQRAGQRTKDRDGAGRRNRGQFRLAGTAAGCVHRFGTVDLERSRLCKHAGRGGLSDFRQPRSNDGLHLLFQRRDVEAVGQPQGRSPRREQPLEADVRLGRSAFLAFFSDRPIAARISDGHARLRPHQLAPRGVCFRSEPISPPCRSGGRAGHLAIAACERYPQLEAVVFDLPESIPLAKEIVGAFAGRQPNQFRSGRFL